MTVHLRSLFARVKVFRQDLDDQDIMWTLQETARQVCMRSGICRVELPVQIATRGTKRTPLSTDHWDVCRVNMVRVANLSSSPTFPSTYKGQFDPNDLTINGTASEIDLADPLFCPANSYYVASVGTTTNVGAPLNKLWEPGDILVFGGVSWSQKALSQFRALPIKSQPYTQMAYAGKEELCTQPSFVSREGDELIWHGVPDLDLAYSATVAICPKVTITPASGQITTEDLESISVPVETERAILLGAQEMAFRMPGKLQDIKQAEMYGQKFLRELTSVKNTAMIGNNECQIVRPNFTGHRNYGGWRPW